MLLPEKLGDNCMAVIVRFVVLLYDRTSSTVEVNKSRKDIFSKEARSLLRENTPPTRAAPEQHTMRAVFQEGYIWVQVLLKKPFIPSLSAWGWEKDGTSWRPKWSTLPRAKESNPVPLPDLYFDSFSYPVASIVFGDMAIVSFFFYCFF